MERRPAGEPDGHSADHQIDADSIASARDLAAAKIPIFLATPALTGGQWDPDSGHNRCGYWVPKGWQQTVADPAVLDQWRPGMAVCAVMGHGLDLLDVDPRSGGAETMAGLIEAHMWPSVYGQADTPSGGAHAFVASMDVHSRDGLRPGLDVKAGGADGEGRGFAFIAPTIRKSKVDGRLRGYVWTKPVDLDRLADDGPEDDSGEPIAAMVREVHPGNRTAAVNGKAGIPSVQDLFAEGGPWADIPALLRQGRNEGVHRLASALRGRHSGWQVGDAVLFMKAVVWPLIDQNQAGHPFTSGEFEGTIRTAFDRYPSGADEQPHGAIGPAATMMVRRASDMPEPTPPRWLAVGWLPLLAVTVLVGDEGIGKSLLWVLIVAYVTTGRALPQIGLPARDPADVIIVITEDSWAEVKARLVLAGADLNRIHVVSEAEDGTGSPVFPPHMDVITQRADQVDPALIVLDAWLDTVPSGIQIRDTQQARTALHPWREAANRFECSVLLLVNTNRMSEASTRDRVGATGALRQKARMLLFAAAEPDGEGAQLFVGPDKANGVARNNAVRFDVSVRQVRDRTIDDPGTVAILSRPVEQDKRIGALIEEWRAQAKEASKPPSADALAEKWLREYMAKHGGLVLAETAQTAASLAGHTARRITAVLRAIGGQSKPLAGRGPWYFHLNRVERDPVLSDGSMCLTYGETDNTDNTAP